MNKKSVLRLISGALAFVVSVGFISVNEEYLLKPSAAKSVSELQTELQNAKNKRNKINTQIKNANNDIKSKKEYQILLNDQMDATQELIDIQIDLIAGLDVDIENKEVEIASQEKDLEKGISDFKARVRAMYMAGDGEAAEVLAGSTDFYDLLTRMEILKRVAKHDNEMVHDLTDKLAELEIDKAELNADYDEQSRLKTELETDLENLQSTYESTSDYIAAKDKELNEYIKNKEKIDAEEARIEEELVEAIRAAQTNNEFVGGEFIWPVPGFSRISSKYSPARTLNGVTKPHKGIDIAAPKNVDIVASNSGTVTIAFNNDVPGYSYGKYIVIDHGGGKSTLYGHCNKLLVKPGQQVKQGQVIAKVGTTGNSTGYHLHFEVRINGQHTDPQKYVKYA